MRLGSAITRRAVSSGKGPMPVMSPQQRMPSIPRAANSPSVRLRTFERPLEGGEVAVQVRDDADFHRPSTSSKMPAQAAVSAQGTVGLSKSPARTQRTVSSTSQTKPLA